MAMDMPSWAFSALTFDDAESNMDMKGGCGRVLFSMLASDRRSCRARTFVSGADDGEAQGGQGGGRVGEGEDESVFEEGSTNT